MQKLSNSVITHVHSRVTQTFNQELWVPRQLGTEAISSRTSPLVQPIEGTVEGITRLLVIQVHFSDQPMENSSEVKDCT